MLFTGLLVSVNNVRLKKRQIFSCILHQMSHGLSHIPFISRCISVTRNHDQLEQWKPVSDSLSRVEMISHTSRQNGIMSCHGPFHGLSSCFIRSESINLIQLEHLEPWNNLPSLLVYFLINIELTGPLWWWFGYGWSKNYTKTYCTVLTLNWIIVLLIII